MHGSPQAGDDAAMAGRPERSAVITFERLREAYAPATVVLTGIAGAISPMVGCGDVVVVNGRPGSLSAVDPGRNT